MSFFWRAVAMFTASIRMSSTSSVFTPARSRASRSSGYCCEPCPGCATFLPFSSAIPFTSGWPMMAVCSRMLTSRSLALPRCMATAQGAMPFWEKSSSPAAKATFWGPPKGKVTNSIFVLNRSSISLKNPASRAMYGGWVEGWTPKRTVFGEAPWAPPWSAGRTRRAAMSRTARVDKRRMEPPLAFVQVPLDGAEERVEAEAEQPGDGHAHDDDVGTQDLHAVDDHVAQTGFRGHHLGRNDGHPGGAEGDPQSGGDGGQRGGQAHACGQLQRRAAEGPRGHEQDGRHFLHAGHRVEEHRKEAAHEDDEDLAREPDPEPQHSQRDPGDGRDRPEQLHEGAHQALHPRAPAHDHAEGNGEHGGQGPGQEDASDARPSVDEDRAGGGQLPERLDHGERAREQREIAHHPREQCPHDEDGDRGQREGRESEGGHRRFTRPSAGEAHGAGACPPRSWAARRETPPPGGPCRRSGAWCRTRGWPRR